MQVPAPGNAGKNTKSRGYVARLHQVVFEQYRIWLYSLHGRTAAKEPLKKQRS